MDGTCWLKGLHMKIWHLCVMRGHKSWSILCVVWHGWETGRPGKRDNSVLTSSLKALYSESYNKFYQGQLQWWESMVTIERLLSVGRSGYLYFSRFRSWATIEFRVHTRKARMWRASSAAVHTCIYLCLAWEFSEKVFSHVLFMSCKIM